MKKSASILFIAFYLCGTLLLPFSDFSSIKDLPAMFKHCKANEDEDLNAVEFLLEHVTGIGQLIEETEHHFGEEEENGDKPHTPTQFNVEQQQIICNNHPVKAPVLKQIPVAVVNSVVNDKVYISDYISKIFRPPIA